MTLRSRSMLSWLMLVAGIVASLASAYGAYILAGYAWNQVVTYKSPYVRQPGTVGTSPAATWVPKELQPAVDASAPVLSGRLVLVIVDGMREDVSRAQMATLNRLRAYGSDFTLTVPQPSLSFPNWTTILTGAPQVISGVTTNWYDGRVLAPTLMDMAHLAGRRVEVVGPHAFSPLFGVVPGPYVSLRAWPEGGYLSGTLIDDALQIAKVTDPQLVIVHLPDLDEAGHSHGGASKQFAEVAHKIDIDLGRLVSGLQRTDTTFVVVADHGHIDSGGHGGWERSAVRVPGVFAGAGIRLGSGTGNLEQVAPTIAVLAGISPPPFASATALRAVIATTSPTVFAGDDAHHVAFDAHSVDVVTQGNSTINSRQVVDGTPAEADAIVARAKNERLAIGRSQRAPMAFLAFFVAIAVVVAGGLVSWRALVATLSGTAAYYAFYNTLYFGVHRFNWSLSALNTETYVKAFMNGRLIESVVAGIVAVAVAGAVYPTLRESPRGPQTPWFLSGWLALGPSTVLAIQATLAMQVAWYYWWYGFAVTWTLPNFMWAFKADLDMVQMTALGAVAIVGPLVTYLIGRYHPKLANGVVGGGGPRAHNEVGGGGAAPPTTK